MINPPLRALRRRSEELFASAERERPHDIDSAALLLFYAVECGLKALYMQQNNLKVTDEERGISRSARSYGHNIRALLHALNVPRASIGLPPQVIVERTAQIGDALVLHEAWRYGEKIRDSVAIYDWLTSVIEWCRNNR